MNTRTIVRSGMENMELNMTKVLNRVTTAGAIHVSRRVSRPVLFEAGAIGLGFLLIMLATTSVLSLSVRVPYTGGLDLSDGGSAPVVIGNLGFLALAYLIARMSTREIRSSLHDLEERMTRREVDLEPAAADLTAANSELANLSTTDFRAGARKRRSFDDDLDREWETGVESARSLALALAGVDAFKTINDGHGGDEFAVLVPKPAEAGIPPVLEDVRRQIERLTSAPAGSLSIGAGAVAYWPGSGLEPKRLVRLTDAQLCAAKRAGRNRAAD